MLDLQKWHFGEDRTERTKTARVVTVVEYCMRRGSGKEDDPVRFVWQYRTLDGERLLAEYDSWAADAR